MLLQQLADRFLQAECDASEFVIVDLFGRIFRRMIIWVAVKGGISDHDRRVAEVPKRPVVRPADALELVRRGAADGWKFCVAAKGGNDLMQETA